MLIFGHVYECLLKEALPKTSYPFAELTSIIDFEELTSTSSPKGVELTFSIQVFNILDPYLAVDIVIFSIYVIGFCLLYGFMGKLSLGHMLFLGTGAYAAGLFAIYVNNNVFLAISFAVLCGALVGAITGPGVVRLKGGSFALAVSALNQIGYFIVRSGLPQYTGGEDGRSVRYARMEFMNFFDPSDLFVFCMFFLVLVYLVTKILVSSPYGTLIKCIKENEERVKFLGYNTHRYKILTYMLSAAISSLAGALWTVNLGYLTISLINPGRNVEVVFASLVGGAGSLVGAILGGSIFMFLKNFAAVYVPMWELALGIALLVMVFWFPDGLVGSVHRLLRSKRNGRSELRRND